MVEEIKYSDYRLAHNGYLIHRALKGKYMHRDVWIAHHGIIPRGHHIHHKNKIRTDNSIDNLECIEASAHLKMHGFTVEMSKKLNRLKALGEMTRHVTCISCDKEFTSMSVRTKFCGPKCSRKYINWLHGVKRSVKRQSRLKSIVCVGCKTEFKQNRPFQKYCTIPCQVKDRNRVQMVSYYARKLKPCPTN